MAKIKSVSMKCGHCGTHQSSPIFIGDTETFETMITSGNIMTCRKCGKPIHCNKENMSYVLADGSAGSVAEDFGGNKA